MKLSASQPMSLQSTATHVAASRAAGGRRAALIETVLVFLVFFLQGAQPAPSVNEPHYLGKARHFWDPTWASSDFFLASKDAHQVFYFSIGWLSRFLSLPAFAWCGRLLTWGLLAWAWRRLSWALLPHHWYAVLTAALFAALSECGQMAGEWVIGGVEAKGFAYALVFLGIESLVNGRWNRALLWCGAAGAFHTLVGGWAAVAIGWAWLWLPRQRPRLAALLPGAMGGLALALPGLWPAGTLNAGAAPDVVAEAAQIYVFQRLPHHLVPDKFAGVRVVSFLLMLLGWLLLCGRTPATDTVRRLRAFVTGSLALAVCGIALRAATLHDPALAARLLRFYWFRLADAAVPLGTALLAGCCAFALRRRRPAGGSLLLGAAVAAAGCYLGPTALVKCFSSRPLADKPDKTAHYEDWLEVCDWIKQNTPPAARFITPRTAQTFKWYAERGEVANWKDIPQDAAGIVEWWRRLKEIYVSRPFDPLSPWVGDLSAVPAGELRRLAKAYQADFLVCEADPPLPLEAVFASNDNNYAVYRLNNE